MSPDTDWKRERKKQIQAKDLPPVDPAIVHAKPLNHMEENVNEPWAASLPPRGVGRVLQKGDKKPATRDEDWVLLQSNPKDYILRLMNAGAKDTVKDRAKGPLKDRKRTYKKKTYKERLHGIFGSEEQ